QPVESETLRGAVALNLTDGLQRHVPGYTTALQNSVEQNHRAAGQLHKLTTTSTSGPGAKVDDGGGGSAAPTSLGGPCTEEGAALENCGRAPEFTGINGWLNTPGDQPLSLASLRGKVVLIDFWTYSCVNCQRALPHVEAWYRSYAKDGLVVVGVHTPEFAFEHVTSNVRAQAAALGVKYPIAIDNGYKTWNAYSNQYWPAEYLIDASGVVRHVAFGEGDYGGTETLIRALLAAAHPGTTLGAATDVPNATPIEQQTPESYLGYKYQQNVDGAPLVHDRATHYAFPSTLTPDTFALSGVWTDGSETATAGADAKLEISYQADDVYLVLGGTGTLTVRDGSAAPRIVQVDGVPKLYLLVGAENPKRAVLALSFTAGIQAYDFTFG
ncbi:MAG: thioredoxin family protein, partial [Jatrophihabitantaceae bacterium]